MNTRWTQPATERTLQGCKKLRQYQPEHDTETYGNAALSGHLANATWRSVSVTGSWSSKVQGFPAATSAYVHVPGQHHAAG